jgi:TP901 family phage tail tape measure protein
MPGNLLGELAVKISVDTASLTRGLNQAESKLQSAANKMTAIGKNLSLKLTLPLVAAGTAAFKMAGDFDQAFRKVNVMLGASAEESEKYKDAILDISKATAQSASDVADAFYQIVSAGYRGADSLDILRVAMEGATGGAADAEQTTAALTKAMNIFQLQGVEGSTRAMDTFFGIVDTGLLTFEQMAQAFPMAAQSAAGLGVSIEEVGAALGTLTKVSGSTDEAATALNATFMALIKPSVALMNLYEEWGVTNGPEAIERFGGLAGVLKKVQEATGGEVDQLAELFPNIRAIRAVLPLATTASEDFASSLETVSDATGRTGEAFEEMAQGPGWQWKQMMVTLQNSAIKLGDVVARSLGPWIEKLMGWIEGLVEWFGDLDEKWQGVIITAGLLAAALGPTLLIGGLLVNSIRSLIAAFVALKAAMTAAKIEATLMWGAITLGVSLAIAGIVEAVRHSRNATADIERQWQDLSQTMIDDVNRAYDTIISNAQSAADAEKQILEDRQQFWKDKHYERMDILEDEYIAELKAIDPILGAKIEAINEEIKAIKEAGEVRDEEIKKAEEIARIEELRTYLKQKDLTDLERKRAEDELADIEADWKKKQLIENRNLLLSEANLAEHYDNQIQALEETTNAAIEEFEKQRDAFIGSYQESLEYLEAEWLPKYLEIMGKAGLEPSITEIPNIPEIPEFKRGFPEIPGMPEPWWYSHRIPTKDTGGLVQGPGLFAVGAGVKEIVAEPQAREININVGYLMGDDISLRKFLRHAQQILGEEARRTQFGQVNRGYYYGRTAI